MDCSDRAVFPGLCQFHAARVVPTVDREEAGGLRMGLAPGKAPATDAAQLDQSTLTSWSSCFFRCKSSLALSLSLYPVVERVFFLRTRDI